MNVADGISFANAKAGAPEEEKQYYTTTTKSSMLGKESNPTAIHPNK